VSLRALFVLYIVNRLSISWDCELLWEKNLENLKSGTLGDPTDAATLLRYWQSQERAHYPYARENVEYFTEILKKGYESNGNKQAQSLISKESAQDL
jgi:hypothetical protein